MRTSLRLFGISTLILCFEIQLFGDCDAVGTGLMVITTTKPSQLVHVYTYKIRAPRRYYPWNGDGFFPRRTARILRLAKTTPATTPTTTTTTAATTITEDTTTDTTEDMTTEAITDTTIDTNTDNMMTIDTTNVTSTFEPAPANNNTQPVSKCCNCCCHGNSCSDRDGSCKRRYNRRRCRRRKYDFIVVDDIGDFSSFPSFSSFEKMTRRKHRKKHSRRKDYDESRRIENLNTTTTQVTPLVVYTREDDPYGSHEFDKR